MSRSPPEELEAVTRGVRACFNRMRTLGDLLHADLGVTTAERALMETLHEIGPRTVPQVARMKSVSRQHIQVLADSLLAKGLVEARENPSHKRSVLLALGPKGVEVFGWMRKREAVLLQEIATLFAVHDLATGAATLTRLAEELDRRIAALEE